MEKIILIGGGGHCTSIIDTIKSSKLYDIVGIIDIREKIGEEINHIKIIDCDDNLNIYRKEVSNAFIAIGSIGNVNIRKEIFGKLKKLEFNLPFIIDKNAIISENATIGCGTFIGKGVIVNSGASIGENCIINSGAIIEHDCKIGDFVHIAPGSTVCGGVKIKDNSHIGAGSVILQYNNIGHDTIIGAGSVVIRDISNNVVSYGNPAREVRRNE